jgi:hypothetical protein
MTERFHNTEACITNCLSADDFSVMFAQLKYKIAGLIVITSDLLCPINLPRRIRHEPYAIKYYENGIKNELFSLNTHI